MADLYKAWCTRGDLNTSGTSKAGAENYSKLHRAANPTHPVMILKVPDSSGSSGGTTGGSSTGSGTTTNTTYLYRCVLEGSAFFNIGSARTHAQTHNSQTVNFTKQTKINGRVISTTTVPLAGGYRSGGSSGDDARQPTSPTTNYDPRDTNRDGVVSPEELAADEGPNLSGGGGSPTPTYRPPAIPAVPDSFSEKHYLELYPDVKNNWGGSAWSHYVKHGKGEGRKGDFTPEGWNAQAYLDQYPDVKNNWGGSALSHYLKHGEGEGRRGNFTAVMQEKKLESIIDNMIAKNDANGNGKLTEKELGTNIWLQYSEQARKDGIVTKQEAIDLVKDRVKTGYIKGITNFERGKSGAAIDALMGDKKRNDVYSVSEVEEKLGADLPNWIAKDGKVSETELSAFISRQVAAGNLKYTSNGSVKLTANSNLKPEPVAVQAPEPAVETPVAVATGGDDGSPLVLDTIDQPGDVIDPNKGSTPGDVTVLQDEDPAPSNVGGKPEEEESLPSKTGGAGKDGGEPEDDPMPVKGSDPSEQKGGRGYVANGGKGGPLDSDEKDEEKQSALAVRRSKDEERLKKIMKQREKWGGASAGSGADSLATPVVTPASNSQGFGGIPGQR